MAADTRTGPLVRKLVEGIQDDVGSATELLGRAHSMIDQLSSEAKGVNGLSSMLKAKAQELDKMIADLKEESEAVEKKMIGASMIDGIETSVNPDLADAAQAAKSGVD